VDRFRKHFDDHGHLDALLEEEEPQMGGEKSK